MTMNTVINNWFKPLFDANPLLSSAATTGCTKDNGGCEHLCLLDAAKTVKCACTTGFELGADGKSCKGMAD